MKRPAIFFAATYIILGSFLSIARAAEVPSPVGIWKTIDDRTGQPKGLVRVYESDGKFFAKIERSFSPGDETRLCSACTDERKNQPIIELVFMRNMRPAGDEFVDGDILDSDSGTVYRCKFRLEDAGKRLAVRGFIGISMFGRSQNWYRE
jgi:uncharacterized protein (DUF2147 family)